MTVHWVLYEALEEYSLHMFKGNINFNGNFLEFIVVLYLNLLVNIRHHSSIVSYMVPGKRS